MKKSLLLWTLALFTGVTAQAGIILSETFTYPDGDISTAPGSPWVVHSGTTSATISNNMLRLTGGNSADVNALLSGGPYLSNSPAVLYSSFKLRLTSQPGFGGTYLAHFKDTNGGVLTGFGGRVWVSTSNTVSGIGLSNNQYRVGIGNGSQADARSGQIDSNLTLNTTYTIVTRFVPNSGVATIWLNPTLETDSSVTATDIGTTRSNAIDVVSYAFRQSSGIGVEFIDDLRVGTAFTDVAGANNPPSITGIAKQNLAVNASTPALAFTVGDAETAAGSLVVSGSSSNPGLVPNANIVFAGSDSNRTVTVTPASNQSGTASITVTVTDADGGSASTTFVVAVGVPTISNIPNLSTPVNTSLGPISFTVGDTETPAGSLTVTATSANQTLVTDGAITLGGSGANRTITISPESGQQGVVTITVTVSDGANSASDTFVLTVNPLLGVLRMDDFNRPDGPLVQFDGLWLSNGGTGATNIQQMQIVGNKAQITEDQSEDVSTELPPGQFITPSYAPASGTIFYVGMKIRVTRLPTPAGGYFAHFRDSGTGFRGRLFVSTSGAATGRYRLGIANNAANVSALGQIQTDLLTNQMYSIVLRYNVGTGESRLWLNPASESSPGLDAPDQPQTVSIEAFTLRQNASIGVVCVDDLKIGTAFSDVSAVLPSLQITAANGDVTITWTGGGRLICSDDVTAPRASWIPVDGAVSPHVISPANAARRFYAVVVP